MPIVDLLVPLVWLNSWMELSISSSDFLPALLSSSINSCVLNHPLVKSSLEGAKRKLAHPVRPKEPLSVDTVQAIAEFYVSSNFLATPRFLFILLIGFYGFFRIDEINSFCLKDLIIDADHVSIYVAKRKNDQYREGHTSYLAGLGNLCAHFPLLTNY